MWSRLLLIGSLNAFDCYQNQRPWMTLNGRTTFYCTNDASFGAHRGNLKEYRPISLAEKM